MIRIGIIGGAGYTAGELIRLLINHPDAEITFIHSTSHAGDRVADVHGGLFGETDTTFTDKLPLSGIDLLFFCTAQGETKKFIEGHPLPEALKVIDLSADYRIRNESHDFIYGLPELNRRQICKSRHVANPGCFATCIQLAVLPLARHLMLNGELHVHAITGSTGAGVRPAEPTHFSWRSDNVSVYKPFTHQHLAEIRQSLVQLQHSFRSPVNFIPVRGNFTRGIFATTYISTKIELEELRRIYETYYDEKRPFFLEGKTIFSMRGETMFYSRRIGAPPQWKPQEAEGKYSSVPQQTHIISALKVSGKSRGGLSVGLLNSLTAREQARISENGREYRMTAQPFGSYSAARLQQDINEGNTVLGGMLTAVNRSLEPHLSGLVRNAYAGGFDFEQYFRKREYYIRTRLQYSYTEGAQEAITALQRSPVHYFQREGAPHVEVDSSRTNLRGTSGSIQIGRRGGKKFIFQQLFQWGSPGFDLNDMGYLESTDLS